MSDTPIPSAPRGPAPLPQSKAIAEPVAKLVDAPEDVRQEVRESRSPLRVSGEVSQRNDDGSVRVRTERGDIDVKVQRGERVPERGERVQVEVQPNRNPELPPERVTVRPDPRQPLPVEERHSSTPLRVDVRADAPPPAEPARPAQTTEALPPPKVNGLPPEGAVIRLVPLPATSLPVSKPLQQIPAALIANITNSAQVIAQDAINNIQTATLNAAPAQVISAALPLNQILQNSAQAPEIQIQTLAFQSAIQAPAPSIDLTPAPANTPSSPPANIITLSAIPAADAPALSAGSKPALNVPIATPNTQAQALDAFTIRPQIFDARIEAISSPQPSLHPATSIAGNTPEIPRTENLVNLAQNKPETMILQNQRAESLSGIVTNISESKLPIISVFFPQTGTEQSFALQYPSTETLTLGTQIHITPQAPAAGGQIAAANIVAAGQPLPLPLPVLLAPQNGWPIMEEVAQILAQTSPPTAQAMMNVTPSPANPTALGPAVLFFVAAMRGGDITQWLGDKAQDLIRSAGKGETLGRLSQEGSLLGRIASEPAAQDWRALNIPMFYDGDLQKIALYYRHEREDGADETSSLKGTRFIFDLILDQMGPVQLDGLFREGRLDIALRTEQPFAQHTQAEMRQIYSRALKDTGVTGELSFQNQPESWVTIAADEESALGVSA